eukprot:GFKZ01005129.1.p1 GENE.GFKZ01005129.1~~GFKZ01005129.1.p1  ORF type:complete len:169 (+),score=21.57 GFKZ01005129.1:279-785(+)
MATDAASELRDKLKVALQDARNLFDDGLIDEREFKDLKAHEISKYKEQLSSIPPTSISRIPDTGSPQHNPNSASTTPLSTPLKSSVNRDDWRPSTTLAASPASPTGLALSRQKRQQNNVLLVDKETYDRLTTPPIFRRRSRNKRKIVLPCAELQALQGLREDTTNNTN